MTTYRNLPTPSLVEKCVRKDPLAWAEFVTRFAPLIGFSVRKALSKYYSSGVTSEEAKDIEQNIIISLWQKEKLAEIKNRENINYWLAVTARNACIDYLKKKQKELLIGEEGYFEKFASQETVRGEAGDDVEKINKIYGLLEPREKIMFKLYFKKNQTLKDISNIMRLPIGTVSCAIARIRKKICSKIEF